MEHYEMLIGASWRGSSDGVTRPVLNPADGMPFAAVPEATVDDAQAALQAAADAQPEWAARSGVERAAFLSRIAALIREQSEELARIVVREQGKPLVEARGEIGGSAGFFDYFATFARAAKGEIVAADGRDEEIWIRDVPVGVVVAIIPWNYPAALFARKVAPAIMAGNTIVVKPHEDTPLSAIALARLVQAAGLPPGVVNVVTGAGRVVGETMVRDRRTGLVTVTGSVRAGREILRAAADNITVVSLELGGKAPLIVMDDADLELAVRSALHARFVNCGQVCTCNERTYVHRRVYDQFLERYVALARTLRVGDPLSENVDIGPKVNQAELEKLERMVERARSQGAEVLLGGSRLQGGPFERGFWYAPTVLAGVTNEMEIMREEIFGPISPVMAFDDFEQAVALANDTPYGLSAYLFTSNYRHMLRAVNAIRAGEIYINKIGPEQFQGFHAGFGLSGMGGDDGHHGYAHYFRKKTVYLSYGPGSTNGLMPYTQGEAALPPQ